MAMMTLIRILVALALVWLLSGCEGTSVMVHASQAPRAYTSAAVSNADRKHREHSDKITRAIIAELRDRGIHAVERDSSDAHDAELMVSHTSDWPWDLLRYLGSAEIRLVDGATKEIIGAGTYECDFWHDFPQPAVVVGQIFKRFDQRGVFRRQSSRLLEVEDDEPAGE